MNAETPRRQGGHQEMALVFLLASWRLGGHHSYAFRLGERIAFAAGESFMGSDVRSIPSNFVSAPATAGAVGTSPISPTPRLPYAVSGSGSSTNMHCISGI